MKIIPGGITAPRGYTAAGLHTGIKKKRRDMTAVISRQPATAAGAFTQNVVQAAPVLWDRQIIEDGKPVRAVIINSGNANACTGEQGMEDCRTMALTAAQALSGEEAPQVSEQEILVCSTGVIGVPLPMDVIIPGIQQTIEAADASEASADAAAQGILTTDTFSKEIAIELEIEGRPVRIAGIAKGSGMIHPNMATMISCIVTDAAVSHQMLQSMTGSSITESYNMISVDGDTSTNDTVLALANGASGIAELQAGSAEAALFQEAFTYVHTFLAKQIVKDGEGAGKFLEVKVDHASSTEDARLIAKSVITSNLVKTAFFGEDANWGRILCAAGYSGADFDPMGVSLKLSAGGKELLLLDRGTPESFSEELAAVLLKEKEITVLLDMGCRGDGIATAWGCDLSYEYVRINGEYRT